MAHKGAKKAAQATGQRTLNSTWPTTRAPPAVPQQRTVSKKRPADDEPIVLSSDNEEPIHGTSNKKRKANDEPNTLQDAPWSFWQPPPPVPQRTLPKKRRAEDKPVAPTLDSGESSQPAPQRKKGKAKKPVVPVSDSGEPGSDSEDAAGDFDDSGDEDYVDDRSAEEIEEEERLELLNTLESRDELTADQAIVLEPQESNHDLELNLENIQSKSFAVPSALYSTDQVYSYRCHKIL